jgi:O-antigen ligase
MSAPKILRIGLMVVVLATVVPFGAVDPFWFNLAALLNGLVFAATLAIPIRNPELLKVYRTVLFVIVSVSAYLYFQSTSLPQNVFSNPIWETVRDLLNVRTGAISVDPAGTIATIPLVVHPFLIFMAALVLLQSDEAALSFWRQLALAGATIAAFGLIQYFLFPGSLLLGEKLHYLDSVTGTFVNRNSAATLFGVATLLIVSILIRLFQQLYLQREHSRVAPQVGGRDNRITLILYGGLLFIALLALFLTGSRGGLLSTFLPLMLIAVWFALSFSSPTTPAGVRIGFAAASAAVLVLAFAIFGARPLFRFVRSGFDDDRWCVYRSTISAIADNPWFGTGFGSFHHVFPVYRTSECGIGGVWDRAHNSFLEGYLGMGLPFAIVAIFVLVYLLFVFQIGYRTRQRFRIIPLTGMAILLLIALHSLVDFSLQIPGVAAYVAAALGAAVSVSVARRHPAKHFS